MNNGDVPPCTRIRAVSYNVHACIGADGEFAPQRICEILHELQADFIGIQELEDRLVGGERVSEYLARNLGMHACRGATLKRRDAHYGNLLLSTRPAARTRVHDISTPGREPRGVIEAEFEIYQRRVRLLVTHFGLRARERRRQVDEVLRIAADGRADVDVVRKLKKHFGAVPRLRTWPAKRAALPLDGVCISPASARRAIDVVNTMATRQASDHLPLVCDLRLPG